MWFEPLPEQCPPVDAVPPNGIYYRLAANSKGLCSDFWSHRKLWPEKIFQTTECIARAVSVYQNTTYLQDLKKLPLHAGKTIVSVNLTPSAGVVKKTGKDPAHYSWWRKADFDVSANVKAV